MGTKDTLSSRIDLWLQSRKNSSLGLLSKLTDVPYVTLRRIAQNECEASLQTAVQIALVIMEPSEAIEYICQNYEGMERFVKLQKSRSAQPITLEKTQKRLSKEEFLIVAMACASSGTSKTEIATRFGQTGQKALHRLLTVGLLKEDSDKVTLFAPESFLSDGIEVSNWLRYIIDEYEVESANEKGMLTSVVLEGFSEAGVTAVHQILVDAEAAIYQVMNRHEFRGDTVLSVGLISNILKKNEG